MIGLVRAELLKVRSTRLWIGLLVGGVLLIGASSVLLLALAGTDQGRQAGLEAIRTTGDVRTIVYGGAQVYLFVLVLAATMATSEYRYSTAAGTYLGTPKRERIVTAKVLAAIPVGAIFGLLAGLLALAIVVVWFAVEGGGPSLDATVAIAVAEDGLQCAFAGALAAALGVAIRSQVVAILVVLGWTLVVEPIVAGFLPDLLPWMPLAGAAGAFGPVNPELLTRPVAALVMLAYVASCWIVAIALERRRDV